MGRSIVPNLAEHEVWFLTGSQTMYGDEVLAQVASQSQQVVEMLDRSDDIACRVVWKPVLTSRDAILQLIREANVAPNVVGIITWMHTFSPAKMWIAGLCALDKPMLHLHTQANTELPWATIDFDFMNLNQAAHGDREFGYIETRLGIPRTTVVGHASDPTVTSRIGDWCRAGAGWLAARSMNVARFGDNMRYVAVTEGDKTEAEAIFGSQINTWGVMDLATLVESATDAQIDDLIDGVPRPVRRRAESRARRRPTRFAAVRRGDRGRAPSVPGGGELQRVHHVVRGSRDPASAPRPRRATTDGRRVRIRRRGRLEDGDARADRRRHGRRPPRRGVADGGLHVPHGARRGALARRAHVGGQPVAVERTGPARHRAAVDRRQGRSGTAGVHGRPRPGGRAGIERHARPVPAGRRRGRVRAAARRRCRTCPSATPSGGRSPTFAPRRRHGSPPAHRTTPR